MYRGLPGNQAHQNLGDIDLNRPPAAEPEPASSTSDHPKEVVDQALSEAEDRILYRLRPFPQANADKLLMEEARAIAQLKGQIVDRMAQLDSAAYFWREKKCNYWGVNPYE